MYSSRCHHLFLLLPLFLYTALQSADSIPSPLLSTTDTDVDDAATSSAASSLLKERHRGGSAFHGVEIHQNAAAVSSKSRYSRARTLLSMARQSARRGAGMRGRYGHDRGHRYRQVIQLQPVQADDSLTKGVNDARNSDNKQTMVLVDSKPIKDSIDELQSIILKQSTQGYKEMLRGLMVSS
jgi:hypothetical protein